MDTEKLSAVTAAVLADVAFEAVGEATKFSTQRYRETIEQIRQTGGLPLPAGSQIASCPTPTANAIALIASVTSPVGLKLLRHRASPPMMIARVGLVGLVWLALALFVWALVVGV